MLHTCLMLLATSVLAQTSRELITESTVTVGRGGELGAPTFLTGVVPVADFGVRWTRRSGMGVGVSVFGGRDFPNEAMLVGLRLRLSRRIGSGMFEGSISGIASSAGSGGLGQRDGLGASLGIAYYPVQAFALLVQLDVIPTYRAANMTGISPGDPAWRSETLERQPAVSIGARLARRPGRIPWIGGATLGVLAILLHE
jgi:hypothetical protein